MHVETVLSEANGGFGFKAGSDDEGGESALEIHKRWLSLPVGLVPMMNTDTGSDSALDTGVRYLFTRVDDVSFALLRVQDRICRLLSHARD
eukprot:2954850-Rhodomonas_salina.2